MSKSNEATLRYEQVTGTHYGYGSTPKGWMPAKKEKKMSVCKHCGQSTSIGCDICVDCDDLIKEYQDNVKKGMCPKCKGSAENMDGTDCDECEGHGITNDFYGDDGQGDY